MVIWTLRGSVIDEWLDFWYILKIDSPLAGLAHELNMEIRI